MSLVGAGLPPAGSCVIATIWMFVSGRSSGIVCAPPVPGVDTPAPIGGPPGGISQTW